MKDNKIATIRSITIKEDGKYVLIPTVSDDGRIMSNPEAVSIYKKSHRHLGKFSSEDAAEKYANNLHEQQQAFYPN